MTAEFVRDDCDNVWFVYAHKIQYRRYTPRPQAQPITLDEQVQLEALDF